MKPTDTGLMGALLDFLGSEPLLLASGLNHRTATPHSSTLQAAGRAMASSALFYRAAAFPQGFSKVQGEGPRAAAVDLVCKRPAPLSEEPAPHCIPQYLWSHPPFLSGLCSQLPSDMHSSSTHPSHDIGFPLPQMLD